MGTDYSFDGFDALEKKLTQMIEREYPAEFKEMVFQIAQELKDKTKERTPHVSGILQEGWKLGKLQKRGDEYYIEVYNNVEYADHVEYGHRTRGGKGFVKGAHMLEVTMEEVANRLPAHLQEWLSDFISTHDL